MSSDWSRVCSGMVCSVHRSSTIWPHVSLCTLLVKFSSCVCQMYVTITDVVLAGVQSKRGIALCSVISDWFGLRLQGRRDVGTPVTDNAVQCR